MFHHPQSSKMTHIQDHPVNFRLQNKMKVDHFSVDCSQSKHWFQSKHCFSLLLTLALVLSGCTILRDTENGEDTGGGNGGNGNGNGGGGGVIIGQEIEYTDKNVDILVLTSFDDSSMAQYYENIIQVLQTELLAKNVNVAHIAYAPMYHQNQNQTPLFYGEGDTEPEFMSYQEAYSYFTSPQGLEKLSDDGERQDGQNLADIGQNLSSLPIYHPNLGSMIGRPYFDQPQDGLLVVWINTSPRRCDLSNCIMADGTRIDEYFSKVDSQGNLSWLRYAEGLSLAKKNVGHFFFATAEGVDNDTFSEDCSDLPGFPAVSLDYMQESECTLYQDLSQRFKEEGMVSINTDICEALSLKFPVIATQMALAVRQLF
jgi:hypothetical protein